MNYSMKEIKSSLSNEKKKEDSQLAIYVHRPISYPVTYLFVNMGITAWTASVISAFFAFAGCGLLCMNSYLVRWVGIALLNIWAILDCVDGNIARVTKTQSNKGAFMDAESGYVVYAFVYLAFGMAAYNTSRSYIFDNASLFIFVGAIASISDILARLIHQKYLSVVGVLDSSNGTSHSRLGKLRKRVSTELGIAGFVLIGGIIAQIFNRYDILTLFYGLYCFTSMVIVIVTYSKKAKNN